MKVRLFALGLVFVTATSLPRYLDPSLRPQKLFIMWNVGQGQWLTYKTKEACLHFDMGGEFFPKPLLKLCRGFKNFIYLTHWDLDHVGFVRKFLRVGFDTCIGSLPIGRHKLNKELLEYSHCPFINAVLELRPRQRSGISNQDSNLFILNRQILITGDISSKQEDERLNKNILESIELYIAGHHGSQTSTSERTLNLMGRLHAVLISARAKRYGHPHAKVLRKIRERKSPVLRTEDWGHIFIENP